MTVIRSEISNEWNEHQINQNNNYNSSFSVEVFQKARTLHGTQYFL